MKKIILFTILLWSICVLNTWCQTSFTGGWNVNIGENDGFSLSLQQVNNTITGIHTASADNGSFIDTSMHNEITINGIAQGGDSAIVSFLSGYCGKQGTAVIKMINPTQIQWRVISKPNGPFYIPLNAIMDLAPFGGNFTMQPNFIFITSGIYAYGPNVSLYISFITTTTMYIGSTCLLGNVSENCRPSSPIHQKYVTPDRIWDITINSNGDFYISFSSGYYMLSAASTVNIGVSYPL